MRSILAFVLLSCSPPKVGPPPADTSDTPGDCFTDSDGDGALSPDCGGDDCDDGEPRIHPLAPETCNAIDDDCDGAVDEDASDAPTWYADSDGDGYGSAATTTACTQPSQTTATPGDCDDTDAAIHPGATDACGNGVDDDCTGAADEGCPATCGDDLTGGTEACDGTDDDACPGRCSPFCTCPGLPPGDLQVHFIDVGYGDATLVISPDGFTLLIDAGFDDAGTTVPDYLDALGLPQLDYVLVSHMHSDHDAVMDDILETWPVLAAYDNGSPCDDAYCTDLVAAEGDRRVILGEGPFDCLGPSVQADIVHAFEDAELNDNANSLVLRPEYGAFTLLVGGDCDTDHCEADLMDQDPVTAYKVHHHGVRDSSAPSFLSAIRPEISFIPNEVSSELDTVLERLDDVGSDVRIASVDGSVVLTSDGVDWMER